MVRIATSGVGLADGALFDIVSISKHIRGNLYLYYISKEKKKKKNKKKMVKLAIRSNSIRPAAYAD